MLLSLKWLREFVPYEGTAQELGDKLTMVGLELEGVEAPFAALDSVVVGHVVECSRHPEAEKLSVCRVDVGTEVLDIVCGAPNVAAGQKVAVAKVGATLPGGMTIKKAKLRGAPSHGMICSESELGLSEDHEGIMVLDPAASVGAKLADALGLDTEVLDISITPNRGDCLSVLGLARETAAVFGLPLAMPAVELAESGPDASREITLEVPDAGVCFLYQGRVIENAVTRKSPAALRYRLQAVGVRAISNLVDVTNYILMELGQPLHAFDLDCVQGGGIIVRGADPGEVLVTLDGQERKLLPSDITIRDTNRCIGLGGVMGGLNSEITQTSRRVFLESAVFNPSLIRKTARRLSLHSEAAFRFERGVDQGGCTFAMNRAAAMMAALSGGTVRPGVIKAEPAPWKAPVISLRKERAESLIGIPFSDEYCRSTLTLLGCRVQDLPAQNKNAVWSVSPPSHRYDLTREADLIEELVRIHGVDRVPMALPPASPSLERMGMPESPHRFRRRIKGWAAGLGLNEAVNYSFTSHKHLDSLGIPTGQGSGRISIMNPLSDELNVLRTALAPGLLDTLRNNLAQGAPGVRVFEVAAAFTADASSETTARESQRLGLMLHGNRFDAGWPQVQEDMDYQDLRGVIEHLMRAFSFPAPGFTRLEESGGPAWLAPAMTVTVNGKTIGHAGRVRPAMAERYHARKDVWMAELDLDYLYELYLKTVPQFQDLPVFPAVRRDITFIAGAGLQAGDILAAVAGLKVKLLTETRLIDVYEPKDSDERNLTFRLTFRHEHRTLKDAEADQGREAVVAGVQKVLPVRV